MTGPCVLAAGNFAPTPWVFHSFHNLHKERKKYQKRKKLLYYYLLPLLYSHFVDYYKGRPQRSGQLWALLLGPVGAVPACQSVHLQSSEKTVLNRYSTASFAEGKLLDGYEAKLTSSKWAKITKYSQNTAYRDIMDLVERAALQRNPGGGRSTSYSLITTPDEPPNGEA